MIGQVIETSQLPIDPRREQKWVERRVNPCELRDLRGIRLRAGAHARKRRLRRVVLTAEPAAHARFLDELHRRQAEILEEPQIRVERVQRLEGRRRVVPPIANELADGRPGFLLDVRIVVFRVGPPARELQTRSLAAVNRTLGILRHAMNWGRGRTPAIFVASPFHRLGVKIKTKGETKRDRRITPDEERKLLEAADKLNRVEHAFAGAQMRHRIVGALETACRLAEMLKIQNRHVLWDTHQIIIPAEHAKDAESRRIPFEPKGRLAQLLKRRRFLGPKAYVFGGSGGEYQGTIRTAWESLILLANGIEPTRTRAHGRVNREKLAEIDLHWHDLRHEAACRWLAKGLDLRAIHLLLGHADLKTTQRYLNVTDEELRKTMAAKLWNRGSAK